MNILYIADPASLHDIRWITFFTERKGVNAFLLVRAIHFRRFDPSNNDLASQVTVLGSIEDLSTVRPWVNWYSAYRIRKLIRQEEIDVLHVLYAEPNSLWALWKQFFRIPVIITAHGSDILKTIPQFFDGSSLLRKVVSMKYRRALNNADHITCSSRRQIEVLVSLGIHAPTTLVRAGVDLTAIENTHSGEEEGNKRLIFMPRGMRPIYNHELTLDAIAMLDPEIQLAYTFVFVNGDGGDRQYFLKIQRKATSIPADIRFLPTLSANEMFGIYRKARLVIMNPLSDGSPASAMEAMACKVPVILPPLPYDSELFGSTFFFPEWNATSLRNKIQETLRASADFLERRAEQNYELIRKHGNAFVELEKIYDIYNELLSS